MGACRTRQMLDMSSGLHSVFTAAVAVGKAGQYRHVERGYGVVTSWRGRICSAFDRADQKWQVIFEDVAKAGNIIGGEAITWGGDWTPTVFVMRGAATEWVANSDFWNGN